MKDTGRQGRETGLNWGRGGGYPPPGEREGGHSSHRVTDGVKVALVFAVVVGTL